MEEKGWAIVGGGFLGMTLALRLMQQGKRVTLFEAAPSLGGLAGAWQLDDIVWDRHYHVTLQSDSYLRSLLRELDLEQEMEWKTTRTCFYTDATFYSLSNTHEFFKFPPLNLIDKLRLGLTIFYASRIRDWNSLEKILVADWLRRWSGTRTFNKIWLPLLRAKLGDNYRETSAAFIWATIARMYAARRSGMKKEVFGYVSGGYARVTDRFEKLLRQNNVCCEVGRRVDKVSSAAGGGVRLQFADGKNEEFDHAVLTVAAPLAERMCPELASEEKVALNRIKYQGIVCASVLLKNPLSDFYITNITEDWVPYTAVIDMSALVGTKYFGGRGLVYLPKYLPSNAPEFAFSDEEFEELFLGALEKMYPRLKRDDVLSFRISRVKYLLPISTLEYSRYLPGTSTSIPGLYLASSAHIVNGTLNVNETVRLAERTALRLADLTGEDSFKTIIHDLREFDCQPIAGCRQ